MTNLLVVDLHADVYGKRLRAEFPELRVVEANSLSELPADLSDVDVLISFGIGMHDGIISRATRLKWVQSLATGVDHFLRCKTLSPDVLLTSGRGIHGPPMRETVVYLMMALGRDAPRHVRAQQSHRWDREFWSLLNGKTAVIVGIGLVGVAIGEVLKVLGMRVVGVTRTPRAIAAFDEMISTDRLTEAARKADYLINVLPGSTENANIFDADLFAAMKPTAYFINAGRGQTVDEAALIECLRARRIAGAGLDVFQTEPLPPDSPFWDLPNTFITPHLGGYVVEYEDLIMPLIVDNMRAFLAGRPQDMRNVVMRNIVKR